MLVFPGLELSRSHIKQFLSSHIRSKGVFRRHPLEALKIYPLVWRPFRRIRWHGLTETGQPATPRITYLDEHCARLVSDPLERLLLWRPKYANLTPRPSTEVTEDDWKNDKDLTALERVISQVIDDWQMAQITVTSLTPELRETQSSIITAFGAFVPRTPARRHRERELIEDRKHQQAMAVALSMVLNCPERHTIQKGILEDCVGVGTIVAEYEDLQDHSKRYLILETAGAQTLSDALEGGRALTRLVALNQMYAACLRS